MIKYFFIAMVIGLFNPDTPSAVPIQKNTIYFTKKQIIPGGFLITELSLLFRSGDQNFRFHQLSYSPIRFWEELRIEGKLIFDSESKSLLVAKKCSVYGSPKGLRRLTPLRSFDCDHIQMVLEFSGSNPKIEVGPSGEELEFVEKRMETEGEVIGVVVKVDGDDIYGFSSNMRYVVRKSKAVFQKEDGKQNLALILDGNDSLVRIQKMDFPIREGDFFKIPKKKATESFLNF
jgi:hypothetical protein